MGGDDWSEFAFMHDFLRFNLNVTDQLGDFAGHSSWVKLYVFALDTPTAVPRLTYKATRLSFSALETSRPIGAQLRAVRPLFFVGQADLDY